MLKDDWGVTAACGASPRSPNLRTRGTRCGALDLLHPNGKFEPSYVESLPCPPKGPIVASTRLRARLRRPDPSLRAAPLQGAGHRRLGRATRATKPAPLLRCDRNYVTVAALKALADDGEVPAQKVGDAINKYGSIRRTRPVDRLEVQSQKYESQAKAREHMARKKG